MDLRTTTRKESVKNVKGTHNIIWHTIDDVQQKRDWETLTRAYGTHSLVLLRERISALAEYLVKKGFNYDNVSRFDVTVKEEEPEEEVPKKVKKGKK